MEKESFIERLALGATRSVGSPKSIVIHTAVFAAAFAAHPALGWDFNTILLVLTTAVSLEAIYLAIFIQMTVNRNTARLDEVSEDVEEIQEDVEEIQEDVHDIEEDVKEISEDVEDITEEMEEDDKEEARDRAENREEFDKVEATLTQLLAEVREIKNRRS